MLRSFFELATHAVDRVWRQVFWRRTQIQSLYKHHADEEAGYYQLPSGDWWNANFDDSPP